MTLADRAFPIVGGWKKRMEQNNPVVMAVLFLVLRVVLIGQGL